MVCVDNITPRGGTITFTGSKGTDSRGMGRRGIAVEDNVVKFFVGDIPTKKTYIFYLSILVLVCKFNGLFSQ